jgi:hypothetical protein
VSTSRDDDAKRVQVRRVTANFSVMDKVASYDSVTDVIEIRNKIISFAPGFISTFINRIISSLLVFANQQSRKPKPKLLHSGHIGLM